MKYLGRTLKKQKTSSLKNNHQINAEWKAYMWAMYLCIYMYAIGKICFISLLLKSIFGIHKVTNGGIYSAAVLWYFNEWHRPMYKYIKHYFDVTFTKPA